MFYIYEQIKFMWPGLAYFIQWKKKEEYYHCNITSNISILVNGNKTPLQD